MSPAFEKVMQYAANVVSNQIAFAPDDHGLFRQEGKISFNGVEINVLLVGNAHSHFKDGYATTIINPCTGLENELEPGVAYQPSTLRKIGRKRCDGIFTVWVSNGVVTVYPMYQPRKPVS